MRAIINSGIILLMSMLCWGCAGNDETAMITRKVKIEAAQLADTLEVRTYPGRVRETAELNLAFRVAGPISRIAVKEGDYVQAGQLVAQMDQRDYEIQMNVAQARYEQVKADAERVIELYNRESVAANDYDKAVAGLKMAESQLNHARDQLNDTRLLAPVSGYIQKLNYSRNELVDAGMPVVTLLDVSQYQVEMDIPVSLYLNRDRIHSIKGIQPVKGGEPFNLRLLSLSRKANHNQLYRLLLAPDPVIPADLAPGMDVKVIILFRNDMEPGVRVPLAALFKQEDRTFIWIYDSASQTVNSREVITGKLTGDGTINLISGLQPGEQLVVAGVSLISENERVEPLEPVSETNAGGLL